MIDAASAPDAERGWRRFVGLAGSTLRRFDRVLATDEDAARALIEAGAAEASVEVSGPLEEETSTLGCNMRERDAIGSILAARPVWLATAVPETEEAAVIAAHRAATQLAHRLLLILEPANPANGPELARRLSTEGLNVTLRSVEGEPDASTEVMIADAEGELGLWYRLAPVSYMAGTLDANAGGGRSPLEPAALGSAIVHGPHTGPNAGLYGKFWSAGAARGVADGPGLAEALSELLSPDKAATMAHSAWRVSTGGATTSERVLELVREALARRGAG
jgi:3-deoxy-D-manno-octulosonic-acid transferase